MPNVAIEFIKNHIYILLGMLCIVAVGVIYIAMSGSGSQVISGEYVIYTAQSDNHNQTEATMAVVETTPTTIPAIAEEPLLFIIHIAGEVNAPGVVSLPDGARIYNAIEHAGGATENADLTQINLAAFVRDAMQIIVPAFGETAAVIYEETPAAGHSASGVHSDGLININTATAADLQGLPGVGPALSQNIIDFREAHGGFSSVEELVLVPRIGAATLDRLRPLVMV